MQTYSSFIKTRGLYKTSQLLNPPLHAETLVELPKSSVFHYIGDEQETGPSQQFWLAKHAQRLVIVDHITTLSPNATQGRPRALRGAIEAELRDYHTRYRRLKRVRDLQRDTREQTTYLIANYASLTRQYRYQTTYHAQMDAQHNRLLTLCDRANHYAQQLQRHQFIDCTLEQALPTLQRFKLASERMTRELVEEFSSFERTILLHVWWWLGHERESSAFNTLHPNTIPSINIRFIHQHRWVLINLGQFDQWRKETDEEGRFKPDALQKRFLAVLIELYSIAPAVVEQDDDEQTPDEASPSTPISGDGETDEDDPPIGAIIERDEQNTELDDMLNTFQTLESPQTNTPPTEAIFNQPTPTLGDGIQREADRLAETGVISASDYKRYKTLANAHTTLKNPYAPNQSLVEAMTITPEELQIDEPTHIPPIDGVLDTSMLNTTVEQYDQRYITNILKKDILQQVMNLTQAGVAVTDYGVETHTSVVGDYEYHRVTIQPVGGRQSTLNFKLPVIKENGTFTINQVDYRLRKQRIDLPIRKVKPNRVALTSYYGRVFVTRNERKQYNYSNWLVKQIRSASFDQNDPRITQLKGGVGTDPTHEVPRVYGILSQAFLSFKLNQYHFFLQYTKRHAHFGQEAVEAAEKTGGVVIARTQETLITVDEQGLFHQVKNANATPLGSIEELLGIDRAEAPIDYADLSVFSKKIPLGVVLGYYVGLETLANALPGTIRRIQTNTPIEPSSDFFQLRFNDAVWLVSRDDALTNLIMGGWRAYAKTLMQINVGALNHTDIYFNLLEPYGITDRHLSELTLLRDLFIDPITRDVLTTMKEPTEWLALLKRAATLLLSEYSPTETDLNVMRIAGYERVAGAVYNELVNSMRDFHSKRGNPQAKVELKPYAIWQNVTTGDAARILTESANPIKNINEREAVTFLGTGGRSRDTMVARTRVYNPSDMGVISESTVDSGDVAINTYLSANPAFTSLRGLTKAYDSNQNNATNLLSTSALLSPAADTDD
jgi:hypothetical protein